MNHSAHLAHGNHDRHFGLLGACGSSGEAPEREFRGGGPARIWMLSLEPFSICEAETASNCVRLTRKGLKLGHHQESEQL